MWSSRLFWKLFSSYAALNLLATVTFVVIVSGWQQQLVVKQVKQRLHDSAVLVRSDMLDLLEGGPTESLQARVWRLGQEIDIRITLVQMDGTVIADSRRDSLARVQEMENHKDRLEFAHASSELQGTSERYSVTLGEPMLYVAVRADNQQGPIGMVRTALPMTEVRARVAAIQQLVWIVGLLVSLAVVGLTYFVAARVVRPVTLLTDAAEALSDGRQRPKLYLHAQDELGTLARSFNRMSDQLEARLAESRESNQRLATILEGMVEGVIAIDDRARIILANAAAGRLLGFTPSECQQRPLIEVVRNHALNNVLSEQPTESVTRRLEISLGDEESRVLGVNVTWLKDEPTTHCILVLEDVTELRQLDTMRQEFVANVSHELKTPLSSIAAYSETLLDGALEDEKNNQRFVQRIADQAERLHELILDLISLARIESGQHVFDIVPVRVEQVVRHCLAEHQESADAHGVALQLAAPADDLLVSTDEEGIRTILNNLIDNAVKYTPQGGNVSIELSSAIDVAVIAVSDTGIGISAEHLPRVFERFYRVDKARSRELGGTGLGLSIVKHLAQSFDGSVEVESQLGVGTTFVVKLPLAP